MIDFFNQVLQDAGISPESARYLRDNIDRHLKRLKTAQGNRKLTADEILFLEEFEKDLAEKGGVIAEEIESINKEIS